MGPFDSSIFEYGVEMDFHGDTTSYSLPELEIKINACTFNLMFPRTIQQGKYNGLNCRPDSRAAVYEDAGDLMNGVLEVGP